VTRHLGDSTATDEIDRVRLAAASVELLILAGMWTAAQTPVGGGTKIDVTALGPQVGQWVPDFSTPRPEAMHWKDRPNCRREVLTGCRAIAESRTGCAASNEPGFGYPFQASHRRIV